MVSTDVFAVLRWQSRCGRSLERFSGIVFKVCRQDMAQTSISHFKLTLNSNLGWNPDSLHDSPWFQIPAHAIVEHLTWPRQVSNKKTRSVSSNLYVEKLCCNACFRSSHDLKISHLASHASNFPSFLRKSLAWAWAFIWLTLAMWNTAKPAQTQHRYLVCRPALEVLTQSYVGS